MDITEFLLARIAVDGMAAEIQREMGRLSAKMFNRALAECEAKRRIVEVHGHRCPCATLRALAQPYRDHPDFDPEWAL